jgi:hypothetical protein
MSIALRGTTDADIAALLEALLPYESAHPKARIEAYRAGKYSISIRIIDPDLAGIGWAERHDRIWQYFKGLSPELLCQMGLLVLVTPRENKTRGSSLVFDDEAPRSS